MEATKHDTPETAPEAHDALAFLEAENRAIEKLFKAFERARTTTSKRSRRLRSAPAKS